MVLRTYDGYDKFVFGCLSHNLEVMASINHFNTSRCEVFPIARVDL